MSERSVSDDIVEQILVRMDLKDLIRFKSVCKSWHSFISSPRFATYHLLKHSKNTERQRIYIYEDYEFLRKHLVGSSNGLVCIYTLNAELIVGNPLTKEFKILKNPVDDHYDTLCKHSYLAGFGYDSSSDDYKVILGRPDQYKEADKLMCFHVLSLKSNAWKVVGHVKYSFFLNLGGSCGILCKGALHWSVIDQHEKKPVILSFDLSTEEFKEIPIPDDTRYKYSTYKYSTYYPHLAMVDECWCISIDGYLIWKYCANKGELYHPEWVVKNYNPFIYDDIPVKIAEILQWSRGILVSSRSKMYAQACGIY